MENHILPFEVIRFTHKTKPTDRFVETNIHRLTFQGQAAALVSHIEINNQWHPTVECAQKIVGKILQEFNHGSTHSSLNRFEQTLQSVNGLIEEATEKLETPIACSVIFLKGNSIYFSSTGPTRLLLQRNKKLIDLHKVSKQENSTFSEVTSGDLSPTDWLMVGNESFATTISSCQNTYWGESSLRNITQEIIETTKAATTLPSSGIMLRFSEQPQIKTIIWEDVLGQESLFETERTDGFSSSQVLDRLSAVAIQIVDQSNKALQYGSSLLKNFSSYVKETSQQQRGKRTARKLNINPRIALFSAVALILIVGSIIGYRQVRPHLPEPTVEKNFLTLLQEQSSDTYLSFLTDSFTLNSWNQLTDEEKTTAQTLLQAQGIELLSLTQAAELPKAITSLHVGTDYKVAIDASGQSWQLAAVPIQLEQSQLILNPIDITTFAANSAVISDQTGNIWQATATVASPVALSLPTRFAQGVKRIEKFSTNLYIYSSADKTIYRVNAYTDNINSSTKIVTLANQLADWTISGDIVVADENGLITSYRRGQPTSLSIQLPVSGPTNNQMRLASSANLNIIAVAANRTVRLYNGEGILQRTLFTATEDSLTDVDIDPTGTVWLGSGTKVLRFTL